MKSRCWQGKSENFKKLFCGEKRKKMMTSSEWNGSSNPVSSGWLWPTGFLSAAPIRFIWCARHRAASSSIATTLDVVPATWRCWWNQWLHGPQVSLTQGSNYGSSKLVSKSLPSLPSSKKLSGLRGNFGVIYYEALCIAVELANRS